MSVRFDETLTEGKGYLVTSEGRTGERPSVVGIGALNVDVVVDAAAARRSGVRPPGGAGRDAESSVDSAEMARLLAAVADMPRQVRLGGPRTTPLCGWRGNGPTWHWGSLAWPVNRRSGLGDTTVRCANYASTRSGCAGRRKRLVSVWRSRTATRVICG